MLDHFGMKPNQAVVFGDGYNDLSMFRPEWLNIAMGNARAELKEKPIISLPTVIRMVFIMRVSISSGLIEF